MDIRTLVESVRSRGLRFSLDGERIRVEAPAEPDMATKAVLDSLRDRRDELRRVLEDPAPSCWGCGAAVGEARGEAHGRRLSVEATACRAAHGARVGGGAARGADPFRHNYKNRK